MGHKEAFLGAMKKALSDAMSCLSQNERQVLCVRYGLRDGSSHSLREAGEVLGISHERVRQLESSAMGKLTRNNLSISSLVEGALAELSK